MPRSEICNARHNARTVNWSGRPGKVTGSVFASEFKHDFALFDTLYSDSDKVGFILVNIEAGTRAVFELITEHRDGARINKWDFRPVVETVIDNPKLANAVLTIFNDESEKPQKP